MRAFAPFALFLLALSSLSFPWDWDTHRQLAKDLLLPQFPDCASEIENGSIAPDKFFKDFRNHHCYSLGCPSSDENFCPKKTDDCPGFEKGEEWIAKAEIEEEGAGCNAAYDLAVASHYFSDSFNPMHQLTGEDYENCHAKYESKIGDAIKRGKAINVSVSCEKPAQTFTFTSEDFAGLEQKVGEKLSLSEAQGQQLQQPDEKPNAEEAGTNSGKQNAEQGGLLIFAGIALLALILLALLLGLFFAFAKRKA